MSNLQIFDITGIFLLSLIIGGMFFFAAIRINRHRGNQLGGNKNSGATFNLLHRLSVVVNISQMGLVGYVLYRVITHIC